MFPPVYSVVCDPRRNLIRMTVAGFFTVADVHRFAIDCAPQYARLRCPPNTHVTLCDASEMKIQTQDVVAAFARVVGNPGLRSRRLAVVVGSSLARFQTMRVIEGHDEQLFRDTASAEAWLFAPDSLAA